jgi:CHASE2 domain-containing sensor protein
MSEPRSTEPRSIRALLLAGLIAFCVGGFAYLTGAFASLERDSLSLRFQLRDTPAPRDVVVVGIDARTFNDLRERWPFPRSIHARLIDRLHAAGAGEVVYDVQFTEPTAPKEDLALYRAIGRAGGAVLATGETDASGHTNVLGGDENLARIDAQAGAANLDNDVGGVVTRVPYAVGGLESLAVTTAERTTGREVSRSGFGDDGAWIDYRGGPGAIPTYSFGDVYRGRVPRSAFRGKIVVVGATSRVLQDVHATPTSGSDLMAGPEVEANAIWTVVHGIPLRSAPTLVNLLLILLLAFAAPLARSRLGVLSATLISLAIGAAYAVAAQLAFDAGWILSVVPPLVALASGTVAMVTVSELRERFERLRVARMNELLEERVRERTEELRETQLEVIHRLSQAAESRDEITGQHIERIGLMCERLALAAGVNPDRAEMLRNASAMHDVGKIGIPDSVLLKPGRLDDDEWRKMKAHPEIGAEILKGSRSPVVQLGREIALTHHERWDGSGYPAGLAGEQIPVEARIVAICDVFDALLSERPYKSPWSLQETLAEIRGQSGRHFDPRLVGLFAAMAPRLHAELGYAADSPPSHADRQPVSRGSS